MSESDDTSNETHTSSESSDNVNSDVHTSSDSVDQSDNEQTEQSDVVNSKSLDALTLRLDALILEKQLRQIRTKLETTQAAKTAAETAIQLSLRSKKKSIMKTVDETLKTYSDDFYFQYQNYIRSMKNQFRHNQMNVNFADSE